MKSKYCAVLALFLILMFVGCSAEQESASLKDFAHVSALLKQGDFDQFYDAVNAEDLHAVRAFLEHEAKRGLVFNFGALVNADIITEKNRGLFKPDIKKILQFVDVKNESLCFMNGTLYNIANSNFFDDFLEIDKIAPQEWSTRKDRLRTHATNVLRSLREVIYEIRLGTDSSSERIAIMRGRHKRALENLNDLEFVASLYHELLDSYQFGDVEFAKFESGGSKTQVWLPYDDLKGNINLDAYDIAKGVSGLKVFGGYGMLGGLSAHLQSNQDIIYLDAIMPLIDPWGKSVRYLTLAIFVDPFNHADLATHDFYKLWGELIFSSPGGSTKLKLIHNQLRVDATNRPMHVLMRTFQNPRTHAITGRIVYALTPIMPSDASFHLVGKSKHSSNHLIAELFRHSRSSWETHEFFGAPRFSSTQSAANSGSYQDQLYYYEYVVRN